MTKSKLKYSTLESTFGAVKSLAPSPTMKELREVISEEIAQCHQPLAGSIPSPKKPIRIQDMHHIVEDAGQTAF